MKQAIATLCLIILPCVSMAETYVEFGIEGGGETLGSASSEELDVAGGFKFAVGIQRYIGGFEDVGLLFTLGFLFDNGSDLYDYDNSDSSAETEAWVLEFIYFREFGPHRIGTGGSYHLNPEYENNLDDPDSIKIGFDDALGLLVRYSYTITEEFQAGVRYTIMDYEVDGESLNADSFGLFISSSF